MLGRRGYNWDEWLRHRKVRFRKGKHFHCDPLNFAAQIRNQISRRGLSVHLRLESMDTILAVINRPGEVKVDGRRTTTDFHVGAHGGVN